jgi:hypothetical protein
VPGRNVPEASKSPALTNSASPPVTLLEPWAGTEVSVYSLYYVRTCWGEGGGENQLPGGAQLSPGSLTVRDDTSL